MNEKYTASRPLEEDEYFNAEDGLIYCRNCHTARQSRRKLMNGKIIMPECMCRCRQEKFEEKREKEKQEEYLRQISRLKTEGLKDPLFHDYSFANDLGINPQIKHAHSFVDHWPQIQAGGTGLLLWGDVGTGKSFFAGCVANALLEQGVPVMMTNFTRVLNALSGVYPEERNRYVEDLNRYSLLILDDLGAERNSEFAKEQMFHVVDSRYRSKKPLIVTTNLTLDELKYPEELSRARIYDRIMERCVPLKINGQNVRQLIAAGNLKKTKELFS